MDGILNNILSLLNKFGLYNTLIELGTNTLSKAIDKDPGLEALTNTIADNGTLPEALTAYVKATPNIDDDKIPEIVKNAIDSIQSAINSIETEPLLDILCSIQIMNKDLCNIKLPDFTEDESDDVSIGEVLHDILD